MTENEAGMVRVTAVEPVVTTVTFWPAAFVSVRVDPDFDAIVPDAPGRAAGAPVLALAELLAAGFVAALEPLCTTNAPMAMAIAAAVLEAAIVIVFRLRKGGGVPAAVASSAGVVCGCSSGVGKRESVIAISPFNVARTDDGAPT
jgi:hypothetical protein